MLFGLHNAPGTFQRTVDVIQSKLKWQFALLYPNDTEVFSRRQEVPIDHVRLVPSLSNDAGGTLKLKMCKFLTDTND